MNKYVVYCHTSPSNKKYVGISCNPIKRWNGGEGYKKNYLFYRAIKKYGWNNFKHEILYENLTVDQAGKIEKKLINEWNLLNPQFGYNLREGGNGKLSDTSRHLMSLAQKGNKNGVGKTINKEQREKISLSLKQYYLTHKPPMQNRHHTDATKEKLRKRVVSEETKHKMSLNHTDVSGAKNPSAKAVCQLDLYGNLIEKFDYATLAAKKLNIDLSSIIKCCKGKQKTAGGYKWQYQVNA